MRYEAGFVNSLIDSKVEQLKVERRAIDTEINDLLAQKDVHQRTKNGTVKRPKGVRGKERFKMHLRETFERLNKRLVSPGDTLRFTEFTGLSTLKGSTAAKRLRDEYIKRGWLLWENVRTPGVKGSYGQLTRTDEMPETYSDERATA